jgi:hypothetical protein
MPDALVVAIWVITQLVCLSIAHRHQAQIEEMDVALMDATQVIEQLHRLQQAYEKLLVSEASKNTFSVN